MDLSVIIPARNEHPQVSFTLQVIWDQLQRSSFDWETILVDNLSSDIHHKKEGREFAMTSYFCRDRYWGTKGRHKVILYDEAPSCWSARNAGLRSAKGEVLFLFDAHVILCEGYFQKMMQVMSDPDMVLCYSPVVWMGDHPDHRAYGYSLGEGNSHMYSKFWGSWTRQKVADGPYRIPMSGTAAMAMQSRFARVTGGWPECLRVYGGGEQWISLLCWMLGGECWIHPDTFVYHYAARRGYTDASNETHFFNQAVVAYALGGEKWLRLLTNRRLATSASPYHQAFTTLMEEAREAGTPYRKFVVENAIHTLDDVLARSPWKGG